MSRGSLLPRRRVPAPLAETLLGAGLSAFLVLLGAPLGLLWAALAPQLSLAAAGSGAFDALRPDVDADLLFAALSLAVGLPLGVLGSLFGARRGPAVPVALAVGGALAALVASRVGTLPRLPELHRELAAIAPFNPPAVLAAFRAYSGFMLRIRSLLGVLPAALLLGYLIGPAGAREAGPP